jgi:hypothetical protein
MTVLELRGLLAQVSLKTWLKLTPSPTALNFRRAGPRSVALPCQYDSRCLVTALGGGGIPTHLTSCIMTPSECKISLAKAWVITELQPASYDAIQ